MTTESQGEAGGITNFNILHGFTEALVRGMRNSFLLDADYHHITQCDTLDDVKLNLSENDYAEAVNDLGTLTPSNLQSVAIQKVNIGFWVSLWSNLAVVLLCDCLQYSNDFLIL